MAFTHKFWPLLLEFFHFLLDKSELLKLPLEILNVLQSFLRRVGFLLSVKLLLNFLQLPVTIIDHASELLLKHHLMLHFLLLFSIFLECEQWDLVNWIAAQTFLYNFIVFKLQFNLFVWGFWGVGMVSGRISIDVYYIIFARGWTRLFFLIYL